MKHDLITLQYETGTWGSAYRVEPVQGERFMSDLIVIGYEDQFKAEEVRTQLLKLQKEYLIQMGDAVVAVRQPDGTVKLNQLVNMTAVGAASGGMWGALVGMLFLNPLLGAAVGAGAGALSGRFRDIGISDHTSR
jgi:uncharacterized membrane protein